MMAEKRLQLWYRYNILKTWLLGSGVVDLFDLVAWGLFSFSID